MSFRFFLRKCSLSGESYHSWKPLWTRRNASSRLLSKGDRDDAECKTAKIVKALETDGKNRILCLDLRNECRRL